MPHATASLPQTEITLRDIHVDQRLSHETQAFTAEIYIADEHLATVENGGRGGCNLYRFTSPEARSAFHRAVAGWVTGDPPIYEPEDLLVGALLDQHAVMQEANRMRSAKGQPAVVAVVRVDRHPYFQGSPRKGEALYYEESLLAPVLDGENPAEVAARHSPDHWTIVADWREP